MGAREELIWNEVGSAFANAIGIADSSVYSATSDTKAYNTILRRGTVGQANSGLPVALSTTKFDILIQTDDCAFFSSTGDPAVNDQVDNKSYAGDYLYMETGLNAGRTYFISEPHAGVLSGSCGFYFPFLELFDPYDSLSGFALGDQFAILDRVYAEDLSGRAEAPIDFSQGGNPGWGGVFQARTWDESLDPDALRR